MLRAYIHLGVEFGLLGPGVVLVVVLSKGGGEGGDQAAERCNLGRPWGYAIFSPFTSLEKQPKAAPILMARHKTLYVRFCKGSPKP